MKPTNVIPEIRIGLLLHDLEGGSDVARSLQDADYTVFAVPSVSEAEPPTLRNCDVLILSWSHWESVKSLFKVSEEKKAEADSDPLLIVLCPTDSDLSAVGWEELGENTSLLPYPLDLHLLLLQIKVLLERQSTSRDTRHRLKEREDVLWSISEVFFSVDHEFRYTFFNEKAQKVGGKSYQEVIGKDMWETYPALKNTEFHRQMNQVAADRQILVAEYLGPMTGGWFEMRIYPSAGGISALFVDITARKKAEESLKQAQEQLTEANGSLERAVEERTAQLHAANERLEEVLYSIAHDLRSPLRSMQGFAQAFVDDYAPALDDRAREYGRRMTSSAIFMDRMLKDLLELSRITKTDIHLESVSLADAWKSALLQQEEKIKITQAAIHSSPDLGMVVANPTLLVQILANLLGNALKFGRKNVPPEVRLWTEQIGDRMLGIYVEDNGIGIDGRFHDKVFRVFERLNGADYEGTGIGLAIARKAAERMKGHLDFTSTPGTGTKFRLTLPRI